MRGHNILQDISKERNQFKTLYTMKKENDWDSQVWQGRSRRQVESNYKVVGLAFVALLVAVVVGLLFS